VADHGKQDQETPENHDRREDVGEIERIRGIEKPEAVREEQEQADRADAEKEKFGGPSLTVVRCPHSQFKVGHAEDKGKHEEYGIEGSGILLQETGEKSVVEDERARKAKGRRYTAFSRCFF